MKRNDKFQLGDRVYVEHQIGSVSGPFDIEKEHKGNGNLFVDGVQFRKYGGAVGAWSRTSLIHATPEYEEHLKTEKLRRRIRNYIVGEKFNDASMEILLKIKSAIEGKGN